MVDIAELAKSLEVAQRKRRLLKHSRPWQPVFTPATSLGYVCERRTVYQRTRPHLAQPIGEELASIFEEGDLHQKDVRSELLDLGYEVVEAEVNFKDARLEISGTIDGKLMVEEASARHGYRRIPIEIKSTSGASPHTQEQWQNAEHPRLRRYFAQITTYLYLAEEPDGLGLFKDKMTGLWTVVPVGLDYEYAETLLQRAERIRDAVRSVSEQGDDSLPIRISDRSECGDCPYRDTVCHPAEALIDPALLVHDAALYEALCSREVCNPPRQTYAKLDESIKERFKITLGDKFIVGPPGQEFVITKKHQKNGIRIDIKKMSDTIGDE